METLHTTDLAPLTEARFLETHVAFEGSSTQQGQILQHLAQMPLPAEASILSVGCGSGILDGPLVERICEGRKLRYVGLEPNAAQGRIFEARLSTMCDAQWVPGRFEAARFEERFDLILFIHSHYYLDDVPKQLASAMRLLKPGGRLVIAAAPRGELNRLSELFWPERGDADLWFSGELQPELGAVGSKVEVTSIDARLDVTSCFDGTRLGWAIRDFVVHADTRAMKPALVERIDDALRTMGRQESDGRWTVPHPVDIFEITAK